MAINGGRPARPSAPLRPPAARSGPAQALCQTRQGARARGVRAHVTVRTKEKEKTATERLERPGERARTLCRGASQPPHSAPSWSRGGGPAWWRGSARGGPGAPRGR
eukprot:246016-Rhodomonas_salina.1